MDPTEPTNYSGGSMATFIQRDPVACRIANVRENGDSDVAKQREADFVSLFEPRALALGPQAQAVLRPNGTNRLTEM
jgi:hypothetical protein